VGSTRPRYGPPSQHTPRPCRSTLSAVRIYARDAPLPRPQSRQCHWHAGRRGCGNLTPSRCSQPGRGVRGNTWLGGRSWRRQHRRHRWGSPRFNGRRCRRLRCWRGLGQRHRRQCARQPPLSGMWVQFQQQGVLIRSTTFSHHKTEGPVCPAPGPFAFLPTVL